MFTLNAHFVLREKLCRQATAGAMVSIILVLVVWFVTPSTLRVGEVVDFQVLWS